MEENNNIQNEEVSPQKKHKTILAGAGGLDGGREFAIASVLEQKELRVAVTHMSLEIPDAIMNLAKLMHDKSGPVIVVGDMGRPSYKIENGEASIFDGKLEDFDRHLPLEIFDKNAPSIMSKTELLNSMIPLTDVIDGMPNKLSLIKNLNLSAEQIDYFMFAPPQKLEGEKQDDYKRRRMLCKLLIKYKGLY